MRLRIFWCLKCETEKARGGTEGSKRTPIIYPMICKPCEALIQAAMEKLKTEVNREEKITRITTAKEGEKNGKPDTKEP